ncbi:MAG TPA: S53 family peptidase [Verrucomicrobiae bacterium]|nr:S53 family peptidase [Verrucomicrobiae bacterium]
MNRKIALALASALTIAGCNGAGGGSSPALSNSTLPALAPAAAGSARIAAFRGPANLANFEWGKAMLERMTYVRAVSNGALTADVVVRMRDAHGLAQYALSTSDPSSPNYRHFLTPSQIAERFGASDSDYKTVARYFARQGMRVGMWPQREVIAVTGTIKQFERAFGTSFALYRYGKYPSIGPVSAPHFSTPLPVAAVMHLITYNPLRTYYLRGTYANFAGYPPQMIASGFDFSGAYQAGYTGKGINVGINGTWAIDPADMALYAKLFNAQTATVVQVNASPQPASPVNGNTGTGAVDPYPAGLAVAPPITAPCQVPRFPTPPNYHKCNPEDYEAQLDTQQVAGLAPGATELFYLAYNPSICVNDEGGEVKNNKNGSCPTGSFKYPLMGIDLADDSLQQTIGDNRADTLSLSWGAPENEELYYGYINKQLTGLGNIEMASLAAEGIAVFVSSGDNGAWECFDPNTGQPLGIACVSYPASDPNVTGVGGVNVPLDESGRLDGQITAWADNTTGGGNGQFHNNVGSGGGVSAVFSAPKYQSSALSGITMREVPDIAMDADPKSGVAQVNYAAFAPEVFADGGTSASAPQANAEWGLVLQACAQSSACATATGAKPYRLGNAAPLYYRIYAGKGYLPYKQVFYDVIYGDNQAKPATPVPASPSPFPTPIGYSAGPGYDMVTGLGVPFAGHLIDAIVAGAEAP